MVAGSIIVFALSVSAYVIPSILSGGREMVTPMLIFQQYTATFRPDIGATLSIVLLAVTLLLIGGYIFCSIGAYESQGDDAMSANLADRAGRMLIGGVSWVVMSYLALPLFVVIAISFTTTEYFRFPPEEATLRWYAKVVERSDIHRGLRGVRAARGRGDAVALLLGVPAALVFPAPVSTDGRRAECPLPVSARVADDRARGGDPAIRLGVRLRAQLLGAARRSRRAGDALRDPHVARFARRHRRRRSRKRPRILAPTPRGLLPGHAAADQARRDRRRAVRLHQLVDQRRGRHLQLDRAARHDSGKLFNYIQFNIDPTLAAVSAATIYIGHLFVFAIDWLVGIEKASVSPARRDVANRAYKEKSVSEHHLP